jgi:hypothetical protein
MIVVYIPAWRESGADEIVGLINSDFGLARIIGSYQYVFRTREEAEKRAREFQSRDEVQWPIYVYEKEVECDPFAVESESTDSEVG